MTGQDSNLDRQFLVGSISPFASREIEDGHYYWMYKFLHEVQGNPHQPLTVAIEGHDDQHLVGLLSKRKTSSRMHLGSHDAIRLEENKLSGWLSGPGGRGVTHLQSYDGTLRELFVMATIACRFPELVCVYNFHWAIEWIRLSESRGIRERFLRRGVRHLFRFLPSNMHFSAETEILAKQMSAAWGLSVSVYPIFSMLRRKNSKAWIRRDNDVLFFPQRSHELDHCFEMSAILAKEGFKTSIAVRPSLKQRVLAGYSGRSPQETFGSIIDTPLGSEDYQRVLQSHRVVVLPYLKEYFKWGSSGKFNESVALGTFPFVPSDTAIATQSNLAPALHHYDSNEPARACDVIKARLVNGFPESLRPVEYSHFATWIKGFSASRGDSQLIKRARITMSIVRASEFAEESALFFGKLSRRASDRVFSAISIKKTNR